MEAAGNRHRFFSTSQAAASASGSSDQTPRREADPVCTLVDLIKSDPRDLAQ